MRGFPLRERSGIDGWIRFTGYGEVTGALFDLSAAERVQDGDYRRHVARRGFAGALL